MDGDLLVIALVTAVVMLIALIAKLASFFKVFAEKTHYLCHEMERADNYKEYCKLRGNLCRHYLRLIPFVNEKNVMRVYQFFFRKADSAEKKERKDSIVPLLLPSLLSIFVCTVCVCSMTWAWYTASVHTSAQKMTAAYYEVNVSSVKNNDEEIVAENGSYTLTADTPYTVTLTASGSVKECGGYCLIENTLNGTKSYTQTIMPENSIVISFTPSEDGVYTFIGVWGSHPIDVTAQDIIHEIKDSENKKDTKPSVTASDDVSSSSPAQPSAAASGDVSSPSPAQPSEPESTVTAPVDTESVVSTSGGSESSDEETATEPITDSSIVSDIDTPSETEASAETVAKE